MSKQEQLKKCWQIYSKETAFNASVLEEFLLLHGQVLNYPADSIIVVGGDFPTDVYFIKEGIGIGKRNYEDGNEYVYFQVDQTNGNLGLLEVLARKERYISTVTCLTEVTVIKVPSYLLYQEIMENQELLRRCSVLLAQDLYRTSGKEGLLYRFQGVDRVRYYLIKYYEEHNTKKSIVEVKKQYQDIAFELGISVRTVGRSIKRLKQSEEIISQKRSVLIDEAHYQKLVRKLNQ